MNRINGKVAIVVGAGSISADISNGSACALTYALHGAKVLCVDRDAEAAVSIADRIRVKGGVAESFKADVRESTNVNSMVQTCIDLYGKVDILHNNVGIEEFGDVLELDEESWDRVFDTNLKGTMLTMKKVIPYMIKCGGGSVVNISSIASKKWSPMQFLSYSTSKAAVNHMTRVIARQYARYHVRCNVIIPGLIDSPHADALFESESERVKGRRERNERCPMGHQGSVWDIADSALFLASDESKYITGAEIVVDGGLSL